MPTESFGPSTESPSMIKESQAIIPHYLRGSFAHDTATHDFIADARGKGRFVIAADTTNTSTYTITIYGRHNNTTDGPSARGVFNIGAITFTSTNSTGAYQVVNDPFPFYLIRVQSSDTSVGSTGVVDLYGNFSAF